MELDLVPIARQSPESFYLNFAFPGPSGSSRRVICLTLKVGATGIEPMTSTVSRQFQPDCRLSSAAALKRAAQFNEHDR